MPKQHNYGLLKVQNNFDRKSSKAKKSSVQKNTKGIEMEELPLSTPCSITSIQSWLWDFIFSTIFYVSKNDLANDKDHSVCLETRQINIFRVTRQVYRENCEATNSSINVNVLFSCPHRFNKHIYSRHNLKSWWDLSNNEGKIFMQPTIFRKLLFSIVKMFIPLI